jgi:hypoxanthine phosphoribosyltransferase
MESKSLPEIIEKIKTLQFNEDFDLIVAIANGGIIPGSLLQQKLQIPLEFIRINYRDVNQKPIYDKPKLLRDNDFISEGKKILLVEDRVKTGVTLNYAKQLLQDAELVRTFAVNGNADYALYDENCFKFPWII